MQHEVVVGNIGTIYTGTSKAVALSRYKAYKELSQAGKGRGANEPVTWFLDREIHREYIPPTNMPEVLRHFLQALPNARAVELLLWLDSNCDGAGVDEMAGILREANPEERSDVTPKG